MTAASAVSHIVKLSVVTTNQQAVSHTIPGIVSNSTIEAFHLLVSSSVGDWLSYLIVARGGSSSIFTSSIAFQSDHEQIARVTIRYRLQSPFRSPQLDLWQLSETEWLLALRRPDPSSRRNRGKIILLARQLPLLDVSASG